MSFSDNQLESVRITILQFLRECVVESLYCMSETNITLYTNYTGIFKNGLISVFAYMCIKKFWKDMEEKNTRSYPEKIRE